MKSLPSDLIYGNICTKKSCVTTTGLKTFSNWPTYPQLYVNGELQGGLDIVKELIESGEFDAMVPKKKKLEDR